MTMLTFFKTVSSFSVCDCIMQIREVVFKVAEFRVERSKLVMQKIAHVDDAYDVPPFHHGKMPDVGLNHHGDGIFHIIFRLADDQFVGHAFLEGDFAEGPPFGSDVAIQDIPLRKNARRTIVFEDDDGTRMPFGHQPDGVFSGFETFKGEKGPSFVIQNLLEFQGVSPSERG
jgi:hypothetical protein